MIKSYPTVPSCQIPQLSDILMQHIGYKSDGVFVEVGAYDGYTYSNTAGLALIGWKGIYVEPIKDYADICKAKHYGENVVVEQTAVSDDFGEMTIVKAGGLSTQTEYISQTSEVFAQAHNTQAVTQLTQGEHVTVPVVTLEHILTKNNIESNFDLLVIDVEGNEWNVLRNFPMANWTPKIVIIEMHEKSPEWKEASKKQNDLLNGYFFVNGYRKVYSDDINTTFVHGI